MKLRREKEGEGKPELREAEARKGEETEHEIERGIL